MQAQAPVPPSLPPLGTPGSEDAIVQHITQTWGAWRQVRLPWLQQVEANARALAGRQYDVYDPDLGQFVDIAQVVLPQDERWRRTPVFNWLKQSYYLQSVAKLTENVVKLGAMPASADTNAATSAALFDQWFQYEFEQMGMAELQFPHYGWVLTAGASWLKLRWDPTKGPKENFYGAGSPAIAPDAEPFVQNQYVDEGHAEDPTTTQQAPPSQLLGDLTCQVISPTSILVPFGPQPHWQKPWLIHEYLLSVEEFEDRFGVKVDPDLGGHTDDTLLRMEYTSYYGNPGSPISGAWGGWNSNNGVVTERMVRVRERWQRATAKEPYGRLTIVGSGIVAYDDINPYVVPGYCEDVVIPFYYFPKPDLPFRQEGGTDLESLLPIANARNRTLGGLMDFVDRNEQPALLYNRNLVTPDEIDFINLAGARIGVDGSVDQAAKHLEMPGLPEGGKELSLLLLAELERGGHTSAASEGNAATEDASGELQREVRFDTDRPWGATLRLHSYEWQRFGQGMVSIAKVCMEDERIVAIAGEDQAVQFLTVRPELFQGAINVRVQPESMVLETRQDKQNRLVQMLNAAAQLQGVNPEYADLLLQSLNYPNLQRVTQRGGPAYSLAQKHLAGLVTTGQMPPVWPEQDHAVYRKVILDFMNTAAFGDLDPMKQGLVRAWKQMHELMGVESTIQTTQLAAGTAAASAGVTNEAQDASGLTARQDAQQMKQAAFQAKSRPQAPGVPAGQAG